MEGQTGRIHSQYLYLTIICINIQVLQVNNEIKHPKNGENHINHKKSQNATQSMIPFVRNIQANSYKYNVNL